MDEGFFLVPDIDEGSIEVREDLLHLSQVNVPDSELVPSAGLRVVLDQLVVFHQGDVYFCRRYVDNQVLVRFLRLHQEIKLEHDKRASGTSGQPFAFSRLLKWQTRKKDYFFLCLFLRKRFLRLCVAILCLFLFLPLGIMMWV